MDKYQNLDDIEQLSQYIHTISKNIENIDNQLNNSRQFSKQQCDTINEKENDDDESPINRKQYVIQTSTNESDSEVPNPFIRRYKIKKKLSLQPPTFDSVSNKTYFSNSMSMTNCHAFPSVTQRKESPSIHEEIETIYQEIDTRNMSDEEEEHVENGKTLGKKDANNTGSKASLVKKKKPIKLLLSSSLRKNQQTNKVFNVTHLNNSTLSNATASTNTNSKKKNNLNLSACDNSMVNSLHSNVLQKKKSSRNIQNADDINTVGNNNSMIVSLRMTAAFKKRKHPINPLENSFNNNWDIKNAKLETKGGTYQKTTPSNNKGKNTNTSNVKSKISSGINKNKQISSVQSNKQTKQSPVYKRGFAKIKTGAFNQESLSNDMNKLDSARKPKKQFSQKNYVQPLGYKGISSEQFNDMLCFMKLLHDSKNKKESNLNRERRVFENKEEEKVVLIQQKWRENYIRKNMINNQNDKNQNMNNFCLNYLINELKDNDSNFNEFMIQLNKLSEMYLKCMKVRKFEETKQVILGNEDIRLSNVINSFIKNNKKKIKSKK